jgi:Tfp pilus assembly protein PilN
MPVGAMPVGAMLPAPPTAWPVQPAGQQWPAGHQGAARAGTDAPTAVQPAVPAVVHAAHQGAPGAAQPAAAGQDGQARPVPAKKGREGAPHPAFPDATARTMRILPIAADLLPLEITELRRLRRVRRLVIAGVALCVALLIGWYVVADRQTDKAQAELTAVQDNRRDLNRKKAAYTQLESTRQQIKDITTQLGILMERDMSWSALLASLRRAAPPNVTVSTVTGSLELAGTRASDARGAGGVVGALTLSGTAPSKDEVAAYVDTLGTVTGLANPFPSEASQDETGLRFTIRVDITRAALGGRFTSPSAVPSASGGK